MNENQETEKKILSFYAYEQLLISFQRYNQIQASYRSYVFTWFFAMFFGIGYSLSSKEMNLPIHPFLVVFLIVILTFIGISIIWYQDLRVCEKFIVFLVHKGKDLEKSELCLPQIVHSSEQLHHLSGYVNRKGLFYIGCYIILFVTLGISILYFYVEEHFSISSGVFIVFSFLAIFLFVYIFLFSPSRSNPYHSLKRNK